MMSRDDVGTVLGTVPEIMIVVDTMNLGEPLVRDPATGGDVAQERHDVVGLLGPAEGDEEQRVVRRGVGRHPAILGSRVRWPVVGCAP